jgi:hypothetical protein
MHANATCTHTPETTTMPIQNANSPQTKTKTLEDIGVKFVTTHVGKIYLLLLMTTVVVVAFKEQLI